MKFYLGTHMPSWLGQTSVPLFVSHHRLMHRKSEYPKAKASWALDSGGFTELSTYGKWVTTEAGYIEAVRRYVDEIGGLEWAAPMDWMCEPWIVDKTGLSVEEHQARTVENYVELTSEAPALPFIPVLQGWTIADYQRCVAMYERAGVDLESVPLVGLGSVCRRQDLADVEEIVCSLSGLRLHGFGVKVGGLRRYGYLLDSVDSMAWSFRARRDQPLPRHPHKSCANCLTYALQWRDQVVAPRWQQTHLGLDERYGSLVT